MTGLATYHFIPAVRRGLAGAIAQDAGGERAALTVRLHATASGSAEAADQVDASVQLYGPGDILGFDARIVTRTDPRPDVGDFEPNYFPFIEFADPDFPWRFSAAPGDDTGLIPWITLIVLEQGEFDETGYRANTGTPTDPEVPWIEVRDAATLPDLDEAWRWAHVQVTDSGDLTLDAAAFAAFDAEAPERVVSRLLCARRLKPNVAYDAFVVPTFKLGCVAANRATLDGDDDALTHAWDNGDGGVQLPYYYRWRFHTGQRGDFEYLVRLLEPRRLTDLGLRPMDCTTPGYGMPGVESSDHVLSLEGALKSVGLEYTRWGADDPLGLPTDFQRQLAADLLNKAVNDLAPPIPVPIMATSDVVTDITVTFSPPVAATTGTVRARVAWATTASSACALDYGLTSGYGATESSPAGTEHTVMLVGLERRRRYHFRVTATGGGGDVSSTEDLTFDAPPFPLPTVVPPIYGRWHAGRFRVHTGGGAWVPDADDEWVRAERYPWIDELNLDPRHRAAAGFGSLVVERQQESLMASAWDQLSPVDDANEILRRAQLGREAADMIFRRLGALGAGDFLRATAPVHRRVPFAGKTVAQHLASSRVPRAALDPALRRVARGRGPLRRRQSPADPALGDMLGRLNDGSLRAAGAAPRPDLMVSVCDVSTAVAAPGRAGTIGGTVTDQAGNPLAGAQVAAVGTARGAVTSQQGDYVLTGVPAGTYAVRIQLIGYMLVEVGGVTVVAGQTTTVNGVLAPAGGPLPPDTIPPPDDGGGVVAGTPGVGPVIGGPVDIGGTGSVGVVIPPMRQQRFCEEFITCAAVQAALEDARTLQGLTLPSGVTADQLRDALCGESGVLEGWLDVSPAPPAPVARANLPGMVAALRQALDPRKTIAQRVSKRLRLAQDVRQGGDDLGPAVASPEFPQPMYEPLRDISQDLVLPGVERVPQNTLGLLETNGRFVESYMVAINHALTGELLWREAPVSGRATYFRQFWDVTDYVPTPLELSALVRAFLNEHGGVATVALLPADEKELVLRRHKPTIGELDQLLAPFLAGRGVQKISQLPADERHRVLKRHTPTIGDTSGMDETAINALVERLVQEEGLTEKLKDIKRIHEWSDRTLGTNDNRAPAEGEQLVLLVRGDLLRKYPNTLVYAVPAVGTAANKNPGLAEFGATRERIFPVFGGTLPPDLFFFGFPFDADDARGVPNDNERLGYYFVLEERVSEARFGMDVAPEGEVAPVTDWDELSWGHIPGVDEGEYVDGAAPMGSATPLWQNGSAAIAYITVQKPVRIAVHAEEMLPKPAPAE